MQHNRAASRIPPKDALVTLDCLLMTCAFVVLAASSPGTSDAGGRRGGH